MVTSTRKKKKRRHRSVSRKRQQDFGVRSDRRAVWIWALVASLGLLAVAYWLNSDHRRSTVSPNDSLDEVDNSATGLTAAGLLKEMEAAYRNLQAYRDTTQMRVTVAAGEETVESVATVEVKFQRSNRIRLDVSQSENDIRMSIRCDGDRIRCSIVDPGTKNFDNQVVDRAAPRRLTVPTLYSSTEYVDVAHPNELYSLMMTLPAQLQVSQLSLLMDEHPLAGLLQKARSRKRLTDDVLNGHVCQRVELVADSGRFVFWIDGTSRLLRKIDFPGDMHDDVTRSLVVTYSRIDPTPLAGGNDFELTKLPSEARRVRNFVLPPMDDPTPVLNTRMPELRFTGLDGATVTSDLWKERVAILCWFDGHPGCQPSLEELQAVHEQLIDDERVMIIAVCTEPTTRMSHADVRRLADDWKLTVPVLRDLQAVGRDLLSVSSTPTLVIIDAQGVLQLHEVGLAPNSDEQIPQVLEKLFAGENLAEDYLAFIDAKKRTYHQYLAAASLDAPSHFEPAPAKIAPPSKPKHYRLTQMWQNRSLQSPGNVLFEGNDDGSYTLFAIDGTDIVKLDEKGNEVARRALVSSGVAPITRIRVATSKKGDAYYVGWSNLCQQIRLYDADWREVLVYPDSEDSEGSDENDGIQDVQLVDLDADGEPEIYVGFAGNRGLHRIRLDGQQGWSNQSVTPVLSMTPSRDKSGNAFLLLTSDSGEITPIDERGRRQRSVGVGTRAIHHLFVSDWHDEASTFLGLTYLPTGNLLSLGIDGRLREQWSYPLPPGLFTTQVQNARFARWSRGGASWLLAGPDGSVHFVSPDGQKHDYFHHGEAIAGLAAFAAGDQSLLVIASASGLVLHTVDFD